VENEILSLTADIVSAHVANNNVAAVQLPGLIRDVHQTLSTVGQAPAEPIKAEPSVSALKSVFADHILCLDCGQSFKTLKRHIRTDHQMTPDEYRTKWDLPPSYPMVTPEYAATRSELAKDNGLGRKVAAPLPKKRGRPKKG
jgi:predicted transcriptional regulator